VNIRLLITYEMVLVRALVSGNQNPVTTNIVDTEQPEKLMVIHLY